MRQHHKEGNAGTDGGGQSRAIDTHIAGKHKEVIAKDIEDTAGQHTQRGKGRRAVIPQKRRQHLIEQEQRKHIFDGAHIFPRQQKQRIVRAEKRQQRTLEKQQPQPCQHRQQHRADARRRKILLLRTAAVLRAAALCAEEHAAADAHQKAKTVDDVPDRSDDRQCRRSLRPVVLAE